jgi:hypothetical protein
MQNTVIEGTHPSLKNKSPVQGGVNALRMDESAIFSNAQSLVQLTKAIRKQRARRCLEEMSELI